MPCDENSCPGVISKVFRNSSAHLGRDRRHETEFEEEMAAARATRYRSDSLNQAAHDKQIAEFVKVIAVSNG